MTKVKFCGLKRAEDIAFANELMPDYIGFVFAQKSRRYISFERALELKIMLDPGIKAVGVFVNEDIEKVAELLKSHVIDIAQLHGDESEEYIEALRAESGAVIIKAFKIENTEGALAAEASPADLVLLDSGEGSGQVFNWEFIKEVKRPYFLAGGLNSENVKEALAALSPWGVDVSSAIETDGVKDKDKMTAFLEAVRSQKGKTL